MPNPHAEDLSAYLDGELTDAEVAELEAELARDPALQAELDALEGVMAWMRDEGVTQAPLGFHRRVMDAVEEAHPETPWWASWRKPLGIPLEGWLAGAAAAAVLLLALPRAQESVEPTDVAVVPAPVPPEGATGPAVVAPMDPTPSAQEMTPEPPPTRVQTLKKAPTPTRADPSLDVPAAKSAPVAKAEGGADEPTPEQAQEPVTGLSSGPPAKGDPPGGAPAYRMTVRGNAADLKSTLLQVAGRYQAFVTDSQGQEIQSAAMAGPEETVVVFLEPADLNRFDQALRKLGLAVTGAGDRELAPDGKYQVFVTLVNDGAQGTDAAKGSAKE